MLKDTRFSIEKRYVLSWIGGTIDKPVSHVK